MSVIFYFVNEELKQVDMGDGNANVTSTMSVREFSPVVPSDKMSLMGLTKTNIFGFFGESLLQQ